jgi:hypothetical protein
VSHAFALAIADSCLRRSEYDDFDEESLGRYGAGDDPV